LIDAFIARWKTALVSERAHYQTFVIQLCALLDVPVPDQDTVGDPNYGFEHPVFWNHDDGTRSPGRIDLRRAGCFVMEIKQSEKRKAGGALDQAPLLALLDDKPRATGKGRPKPTLDPLLVAKREAESYARALDEWPLVPIIADAMSANSVKLIESRTFHEHLVHHRACEPRDFSAHATAPHPRDEQTLASREHFVGDTTSGKWKLHDNPFISRR